MLTLITGGAGGIGRELARAFASRGHDLVLVDLDVEGLQAAAEDLLPLGVRCHTYAVDLTDPELVDHLQLDVSRECGDVDVLVNNAGVGVVGDFLETPLDEWHWLMDVNLWGYIHTMRAFLPAMVERGSGHLVNVASAAGLMGVPTTTTYCASKFAVAGVTEALYNELKPKGVRVTLACPYYVRTPILAGSHYFGYSQGYARNMLKAAIEPREVAEAIALAVDRGKFLVIPGRMSKVGYYVRRLSHRLYLKVQGQYYKQFQGFRD